MADHSAYFDPVFSTSALYTSDRYEEASRHLDSAYSAFPNPSPLDLSRKYYFKLDHYWLGQHDPRMASIYIDSILNILADFKNNPACSKTYGLALLCQGDLFREQLQFSEAIDRYFQGREYIQRSGDTCMFYEFDGRIAMVYYRQKKYADAVTYFREAFLHLNTCRQDTFYRFHYQQGQLDNIGLCYYYLNRIDSALFYYDSALRYIQLYEPVFKGMPRRERNIMISKGVIYGNKSEALLKTGDTSQVENLYKTSISINLQKGSEISDAEGTIAKLIDMLLSQRRYSEAQVWLEKLNSSLDSFPNTSARLRWLFLQSQFYELKNQSLPALSFLHRYLRMKDSLDNINNPLTSLNTQQQFNFLAKDFELKLLKKQDEVKNAYLIISLLFSALALGIILQVWYNAKKAHTNAKKLQVMNDTISRQNEILEESLSALEQSQQNNTKMMRIVAHDLRNPIGAIIPLSELLHDSGAITDSDSSELLTIIRESATHSLTLISEMMNLDIASDIRKEPVELHTVIQYCIGLLQQKAREKGQTIVAELHPSIVDCDREKMWRVFSNLITNAIKFSPAGAVIRVSMENSGSLVRIAVKDNGIGIPDDIKNNLFSLSGTARRSGTSGEQSFGLGLFICKQIVEAHGGRIWAESSEGNGSTFWIELTAME
ncbi:tetratricopeptide repeat-containing sensor histidine kinase [Chitinophaga sp. 212800010-3]|uniref:tetratricopeptide repeat-containing sensor histidine kinase n=1 Tax=unclassified Chitinophaga TaxID=2619133 RepID=UPI002E0DC1A8